MLLEIFKLETATVAFLSYRRGISGADKQRDLHEARSTRLERGCPESTILLHFPRLLSRNGFGPRRAKLIWLPPLWASACPHQPFHHKWRVAPDGWEKGRPLKSGGKPRRTWPVSSVLRVGLISNKVWVSWFNTSQEIAITVPDSTASKCYFSCSFPTV